MPTEMGLRRRRRPLWKRPGGEDTDKNVEIFYGFVPFFADAWGRYGRFRSARGEDTDKTVEGVDRGGSSGRFVDFYLRNDQKSVAGEEDRWYYPLVVKL